MKKLLNIFIALTTLILALAGCEEDAELTRLKKINFDSPVAASSEDVVLTEDNTGSNALTVTWSAVDYFVEAPVTYFVQVTTSEDASLWSKAIEKEAGDDVSTASFTGEELNTIAIALGMEPGVKSALAIRVRSFVDRPAFSDPISINVTPFATVEPEEPLVNYPSIYIAGDYQGWNIGAADSISSPSNNGVYEGYIYIPSGGTNEFKLYAQKDWNPTSYGSQEEGKLIVANYAGDNFAAPSDGYFLLSVNINDMTYVLMKTTWSIIGDATPGGWDGDTQLTYDPENKVWQVTADMTASGSYKFRANNAWQMNFGVDENGAIAYADHPVKEYVERANLTVPEDGNYTITLNLQYGDGNYRYKIKKN